MFLNISNHKSASWSKEQLAAARELGGGEIIDIAFPAVPSTATTKDVVQMAADLVNDVYVEGKQQPITAMVQGEMTLTLAIVSILREIGVVVVAACSDRCTEEVVKEDGTTEKRSVFKFVQFREYPRA
jgi:hypothetical protein